VKITFKIEQSTLSWLRKVDRYILLELYVGVYHIIVIVLMLDMYSVFALLFKEFMH